MIRVKVTPVIDGHQLAPAAVIDLERLEPGTCFTVVPDLYPDARSQLGWSTHTLFAIDVRVGDGPERPAAATTRPRTTRLSGGAVEALAQLLFELDPDDAMDVVLRSLEIRHAGHPLVERMAAIRAELPEGEQHGPI